MRSPLPLLFSLVTAAAAFMANSPVASSPDPAPSTTILHGADLFATRGCAH